MSSLNRLDWKYPIKFEAAFHGYVIDLNADETLRQKLSKAYGMVELKALSVKISTEPKNQTSYKGWVHLKLELKGLVTQECGVSLELFDNELNSELEVDLVRDEDFVPNDPVGGENELSIEDLDDPDIIDGGVIDLALYIIEALGAAYNPYARKPGVVFVEPEPIIEPSPFAVLAQLKPKI